LKVKKRREVAEISFTDRIRHLNSILGAFITFTGDNLTPKFTTFDAGLYLKKLFVGGVQSLDKKICTNVLGKL
jgi:hypothetical protein